MTRLADSTGERRLRHIGPWRLLDLAQATLPFRASLFGGTAALPEYGPPDVHVVVEPEQELPGSNIGEGEQQQAVQRERARRFVRARRREQSE
jgi:hypothetical protein